jgi:predicted transcriptional regulator
MRYCLRIKNGASLKNISALIQKPEVIFSESETLALTIDKMLVNKLSTAPVIDEAGVFLGQITDSLMIKAIVLNQKEDRYKTLNDLRSQFLQPPTSSQYSSLESILKKIFISESQRVFILDSEYKLKGVVDPKNVLKYLYKNLNLT